MRKNFDCCQFIAVIYWFSGHALNEVVCAIVSAVNDKRPSRGRMKSSPRALSSMITHRKFEWPRMDNIAMYNWVLGMTHERFSRKVRGILRVYDGYDLFGFEATVSLAQRRPRVVATSSLNGEWESDHYWAPSPFDPPTIDPTF